jgi:hypothetical protein
MAASFPTSVKSFSTKADNVDDVMASHINDIQDEVVAIETHLITNYSVFYPRTTPLTSTDWDGDAHSNTDKTLIDLSSVFGAPAGIEAVLVYVQMRDSGSAGAQPYIILSPNNTATSGLYVRAPGITNDYYVSQTLVVPCDANGDIYYQISATGTDTMDVYLQIWGYWV